MKTTRTMRIAVIAMAAGLALTGCAGSDQATFTESEPVVQGAAANNDADSEEPADDSPADEDEQTQGASGAASDEEPDQDDTAAESAAAAGVDLADLGDPVATATVPAAVNGDDEATMEISLYGLVREGDTVTATYSFRVDADPDVETRTDTLFSFLNNTAWQPHLVDPVNLRRHDILSSGPSVYVSTDRLTRFQTGSTLYGFATFAAPPEDVEEMNVQLVDGAPLATAVPVQ